MEYFAFISYKREDEKWAKWLQNKLEHYKLPSNLNGRTDLPKEIRPVFRDQSDLAAGVLADEIQKALETSKYLILICSPLAAQSQWVGKEVQSFIDMGRTDKIIPFIVDGKARAQNPEEECFPSALLNLPADKELLGVNINEMGRDAAAVKVVAQMFGLKFDVLWQRFGKEQKKKRVMTTIVVAVMVLTGLFVASLVRKQRIEVEKQRAEAEMQRMKAENENWLKMQNQSRYLAEMANELVDEGQSYEAQRILLEALPKDLENPDRPYSPDAEKALRNAVFHNNFNLGYVNNAKFSPDGRKIAMATGDALKIWDAETRQITQFSQYRCVADVAFSPDGKNIAIGLYEGGIQVIEAASGKELKKIGGQEIASSIDYDPSGDFLVTTSDFENLQIWDMQNGKQLLNLEKLNLHYVFDVAQYSPNGKQVLYVSSGRSDLDYSCEINIMDAASGGIQQVHELENGVCCAGFAPDNSFVFAVTYDWELHRWDALSGEELPKSSEKATAFGPDGKQCVFSANDIRIVDKEGENVKVIKGAAYCDIARFSPNGKYILTIKDDNDVIDAPGGILEVWDAISCEYEMIGHTSFVESISYSSDGKLLVSTSHDNTIKIWDMESGKEVWQLPYYGRIAIFSPDGRRIVYSEPDSIVVWDFYNKKMLFKHPSLDYFNNGQGFDHSPVENRIVIVNESEIRIVDSRTGKAITQIKGEFCSVGYNNDGSQIVYTDHEKGYVVNVESCELLREFDMNDSGCYDYPKAMFSPNGQLILYYIIEEGGEVRSPIYIVDLETNQEVCRLNNTEYYSVFFSPDSKKVIVDNSIIDIESGREVARLENVHDFVYSPNGRNIAWDRNNMICISKFLSLQELINNTRERFKDEPLTPEERRKYQLD